MKDKRILYVSSVVPYLAENEVSLMSYDAKDGQRSRRAN
jgi:starch synthase